MRLAPQFHNNGQHCLLMSASLARRASEEKRKNKSCNSLLLQERANRQNNICIVVVWSREEGEEEEEEAPSIYRGSGHLTADRLTRHYNNNCERSSLPKDLAKVVWDNGVMTALK